MFRLISHLPEFGAFLLTASLFWQSIRLRHKGSTEHPSILFWWLVCPVCLVHSICFLHILSYSMSCTCLLNFNVLRYLHTHINYPLYLPLPGQWTKVLCPGRHQIRRPACVWPSYEGRLLLRCWVSLHCLDFLSNTTLCL